MLFRLCLEGRFADLDLRLCGSIDAVFISLSDSSLNLSDYKRSSPEGPPEAARSCRVRR